MYNIKIYIGTVLELHSECSLHSVPITIYFTKPLKYVYWTTGYMQSNVSYFSLPTSYIPYLA